MTHVSDQSTQYGFAPLAIARIKGAQQANKIAVYLLYAAIFAFMVFGTIASIKMFHNNALLYRLFFNLPSHFKFSFQFFNCQDIFFSV